MYTEQSVSQSVSQTDLTAHYERHFSVTVTLHCDDVFTGYSTTQKLPPEI
jgi:hypothetical protein